MPVTLKITADTPETLSSTVHDVLSHLREAGHAAALVSAATPAALMANINIATDARTASDPA